MAERFVAVAGNIGVGKTTLTTWLMNTYQMKPVFEPFENNPYLDDFYADMATWGFHSQVWFLSHKYRLHLELEKAGGKIVQDRTIYEDAEIFATHLHRSGQMSERDWATYNELYTAMKATLQPPDLLIYLRCSVRAIKKRIRQRGRPSEQNIPTAYLKTLNGLYEEWLANWKHSQVLVWDTEKMDYLGDLTHAIEFDRALRPLLR